MKIEEGGGIKNWKNLGYSAQYYLGEESNEGHYKFGKKWEGRIFLWIKSVTIEVLQK